MSRDKKVVISALIKFLIFGFSFAGMLSCFFGSGFMGGPNILFKYFTFQSNVWIALFGLIAGIVSLKNLKSGVLEFSRATYVLQLVFTVSITLTGIVFCFVLLPSIASDPAMRAVILDWPQIFLHVIVPILSVVDFIGFTRPINFKYKLFDILFALIPPIYYWGFSAIGYFKNWDFGGANYPYFFLNYGSPAGFVGFSTEMPYFMGVLYWILAIGAFVLIVASIFRAIVNKMIEKNKERML